jgi:hypothetical protein
MESIMKKIKNIAVAAGDILKNTQITEANAGSLFVKKQINAELVDSNTVTDINSLIGMYVSDDVIYGKAVINASMFESTKDIMTQYNNPVTVSFTVSSIADAVCGRIRKGDYINLCGIDNEQSRIVIDNLYVLAAYDSSGSEIAVGDTTTTVVNFTVIIESGEGTTLYGVVKNSNVTVSKKRILTLCQAGTRQDADAAKNQLIKQNKNSIIKKRRRL